MFRPTQFTMSDFWKGVMWGVVSTIGVYAFAEYARQYSRYETHVRLQRALLWPC